MIERKKNWPSPAALRGLAFGLFAVTLVVTALTASDYGIASDVGNYFYSSLRQFAWATPMAWGMDGIHDLILRDRGLAELLPTLGALFAYGVACLLLGLRLHRFAD